MKSWWPVLGIIFAVTLAYVIGVRLSESAMAVVIGVVFGVAASVPTSLIVLLALRRSSGRESGGGVERVPSHTQPPVVVVAPPAQASPWPGQRWSQAGGMYLPPVYEPPTEESRSQRRFRVVGED